MQVYAYGQDTIAIHQFWKPRTMLSSMGNYRYAYSLGEAGPAEIGRRGKNLIPYFKAYPDALSGLKKARRNGLFADIAGFVALDGLLLMTVNADDNPTVKQKRWQGVFFGGMVTGTVFAIIFEKKSRKHFKKSIHTYNSLVLKSH